jgi:polar amino acid transport system substrate-binding protein
MVALEQGVVDAVIFDDISIESYIEDKPSFIMLGIIPTGEEYGVAMRSDDTELHDIMNRGLAELMFFDKWDDLLNKYIILEEDV